MSAEGQGSSTAGSSGDTAQGVSVDVGSGDVGNTSGESGGNNASASESSATSSSGREPGPDGVSANSGGKDSSHGSSAGNPGTDHSSGPSHETSAGESSGRERGSKDASSENKGSTAGALESKDSSKAAPTGHSDFGHESSSAQQTGDTGSLGSGIDTDKGPDNDSKVLSISVDDTSSDDPKGYLIEGTGADTGDADIDQEYQEVPDESSPEATPDATDPSISGPPSVGGGGRPPSPPTTGTTGSGNSDQRVGVSKSDPGPSLVAPDLEADGVVETSNAEAVLGELDGLDFPIQGRIGSSGDAHREIGVDGSSAKQTGSGPSSLLMRPGLKTDQDEALEAVENGAILPLREALKQVTEAVSGKVIDVKMNQTAEGSVYQVKIRTAEGEIRNIVVDAKTGKILESLSY